jgi:hypothetical protein
MDKENFVPLEESIALKDLGFDEYCFAWSVPGAVDFIVAPCDKYKDRQELMLQFPLKQQVFKWFRDEHKLEGWVVPWGTGEGKLYSYYIEDDSLDEDDEFPDFETWEEAELECIRHLIQIVKTYKDESKSESHP